MKIGEIYTVEVTGKVVKKELYKDNVVRVWIENLDTNEAAIVVEKKGENDGIITT